MSTLTQSQRQFSGCNGNPHHGEQFQQKQEQHRVDYDRLHASLDDDDDDVQQLKQWSTATARRTMGESVARVLDGRYASVAHDADTDITRLSDEEIKKFYRLICKTASRNGSGLGSSRTSCVTNIFPLPNFHSRDSQKYKLKKLFTAKIGADGDPASSSVHDVADDIDREEDDDDDEGYAISLDRIDEMRDIVYSDDEDDEEPTADEEYATSTVVLGNTNAVTRESIESQWQEQIRKQREHDAYDMPSGNVIIYQGNAKLDPRMFDPKRTCEYAMLFKVYDSGNVTMLDDATATARIADFLSKERLISKNITGPTISGVMGMDLGFASPTTDATEQSSHAVDPLAETNAETRGKLFDMCSRMADCGQWRPILGGSDESRVALVQLPSNTAVETTAVDGDKTEDELYILVHSAAEASSLEHQGLVAYHSRAYPEMTLRQYMLELPYYQIHKKNSYRNACHLAYQFASVLGLSIRSCEDVDYFVSNIYTDAPPQMGVPDVVQCMYTMEETNYLRPDMYSKYLDRMDAVSNRQQRPVSATEVKKYFFDNRQHNARGLHFTYFNGCAMNELYHPFIDGVSTLVQKRPRNDPSGQMPSASIMERGTATKSVLPVRPIVQRSITLVDSDKPVRLVDRVYNPMTTYKDGITDQNLTIEDKDWRAPGFIAIPVFSVHELPTKVVQSAKGVLGSSDTAVNIGASLSATPHQQPRQSLASRLAAGNRQQDVAEKQQTNSTAIGGSIVGGKTTCGDEDKDSEFVGAIMLHPHRHGGRRHRHHEHVRHPHRHYRRRHRHRHRHMRPFVRGILPQWHAMHHTIGASVSGDMSVIAARYSYM